MLALLLRTVGISAFTQGVLTGDEIFDSQIQIYRILTLQNTYSGWSHYTHYTILRTWYELFGFSMLSPRAVSILISVLAIVFTYLVARRIFNTSVALLSALFLAFSTYHIHFSRLAMVNFYAVFFGTLFLYLYVRALEERRPIVSLLAGISLCLGMFGYPGFLPIIPATLVSVFVLACFNYRHLHRDLAQLIPVHLYMMLAYAALFSVYYYLHTRLLHNTSPLFRGGGYFTLDFSAMKESASITLRDMFVHAQTWYVHLGNQSFFEKIYLPLAVIGLLTLITGRYLSTPLLKKLTPDRRWAVLSFFVVLFVSSLVMIMMSGAYPGARRVIVLLPFYYIIAALGVHQLLRQWGRLDFLLLLLLMTVVFFAYTVPLGEAPLWTEKSSMNTHDDALYSIMGTMSKSTNLVFNLEELGAQYAGEQYLAYFYLNRRFNAPEAQMPSIRVIDQSGRVQRSLGQPWAATTTFLSTHQLTDYEKRQLLPATILEEGQIGLSPGQQYNRLFTYVVKSQPAQPGMAF